MRILLLALAALLLGAAPAEVPPGKFQIWHAFDSAPLVFRSGGLTVKMEALPCPVQGPTTEGC